MRLSFARLANSLYKLSIPLVGFACCVNNAQTQSRETRVMPTVATPTNITQHYYAVVVGNNDYQFQQKLKTAVNDAEAVSKMLSTQYGFEVQLLLNATRSQIMGELNKQRRTLDGNSNLLIYYAGHGTRDEVNNLSFWLPVDAATDDTTNWIDSSSMTSLVKSMAARHVLVVSDSCFSAGMTRAAVTPADRQLSLAKMMEEPSRTLMASGSLEPVSDAGGTGHSIFAEAFLRGLADPEREEITARQLFTDTIEPVVRGRGSQTPVYAGLREAGVDRGDFVFIHHAGVPSPTKNETAQPKPNSEAKPTRYEAVVIDSMSVADALATVNRVQTMMPKGDAGQIAAIESLVRVHHSLSGLDLSGVSLRDARIPNSDFSDATLVAGDLGKVEAGSTNLSKADLAFSTLQAAHLEGTDLSAAKLDFAIADGAQLQGAKAAEIRGFAFSGRGTDWRNADLHQARFMFADLRDAKFDGADLRGAFFVGSDLTGATFRDTLLENTDFSGARVNWEALNERQRAGACVTPGDLIRNVSVLIIDEIPSARFDGGIEHSRWVETMFGLALKSTGMKACGHRNLRESLWYPVYSFKDKEIPTDQFAIAYPDSLVKKRGSEMRDRINERHDWKLHDMDAECLAHCAEAHCTCF